MKPRWLPSLAAWLLCTCVATAAPEGKPGGDKSGSRMPVQTTACCNVPAHALDLILCRPTRDSVTISVLAYQDIEGTIAYGTTSGQCTSQTPPRQFKKGEPAEVVLGPLQADTQYYYEFRRGGAAGETGAFHTQRPAGKPFVFTLTADSHLDEHTSPEVYRRTLANARGDAPDFHIDLGDTFMTEKHASREDALKQYLAQRYFFDSLCRTAPLFFVLGNHDGESPRGRDGDSADSLPVWANAMRERYFPNPVPDAFFTGNATKHPHAGLLQDYYAWEWGDALFVALDPFWFSQRQRGANDNWKRTLGPEQYQWLARTLEASKARYKFVFIHHLVGGLDRSSRGGAEAATLYEWGGKNPDGSDGFAQARPGWALPIHQLLAKNHVNAVFHGHDHLYAKQELGGIVYQEVPQPGDPRGTIRSAEEYGYKSGTILPSSGYLRVAVAPAGAKVDFIRPDKSLAHSYTIAPTGGK